MIGRLRAITVDVLELERSIAFYEAIFGLTVVRRYEQYVWFGDIAPGVQLILQQVDDVKLHKNRAHMDVSSEDAAGFLDRLIGLGGSVVGVVDDPAYGLTVVADPDGNEFCLLHRLSAGLTDSIG